MSQSRPPTDAVESEQRLPLGKPVVRPDRAGALALGRRYWSEVERATAGTVRVLETPGVLELRLGGRGPALLRLDGPEVIVEARRVGCRYTVAGGLLARRPGGTFTLAQADGATPELHLSLTGFAPRLGARPERPSWTGALYGGVQARIHDAIGRRFFERLRRERA